MTTVPPLGGELEQILGYLDHYRDELLRKTADLSQEQLFQAVPPTTMTLGGLVKHLALVEDSWFHRRFAGLGLPEPWAGVDWGADPDWEWHSAADDSVEELFEQWRTSVARSRAVVEGRALDDVSAKPLVGAATSTCAGCCCTWWRSTPGTSATRTCCARRSTARPAEDWSIPTLPDWLCGAGQLRSRIEA